MTSCPDIFLFSGHTRFIAFLPKLYLLLYVKQQNITYYPNKNVLVVITSKYRYTCNVESRNGGSWHNYMKTFIIITGNVEMFIAVEKNAAELCL